MAGHSKWANIKHRKGAQDAIRGKIFAKFSKEIMVAAARGGGDIETNPALRMVVSKARAKSMPKANIEKAIAKATGASKEGADFKEVIYSGTLAGGVTFLVICLTDNMNRVVSNIQSLFKKAGGQVGKQGSIPYVFDQKGILEIEKNNIDEEELMMFALENGADDFKSENEFYEIYCEPSNFLNLKNALDQQYNFEYKTAEVTYIPNQEIALDEEKTKKLLEHIEKFEDDEDVQEVFHNMDLSILSDVEEE
ncbi:YebC/PmpR family DNA-binding transcriptional regulator [Mesomycoplasma lagogenitalium]|uniref:Probable transcriptional regulatory protein QEG99_02245 n=1 Tax=Mesomycoplasma lagogenitalium TaxID=171286 RepID=A0ABY8LSP1_9BACT|nr:YebC/PmpR family DNA-binding transcriptional regulator [Mesomycoplasma lagogenitalium]WGI36278.1 YebC/PmpR family DNA-binding transcriptional regulator [Mesomycoplasma lagogenitalium]